MRSTRIGPRAGSLAAREAGARTKNHMQISSSYDTHESRRSTQMPDRSTFAIRIPFPSLKLSLELAIAICRSFLDHAWIIRD
jgi:hypothetical protein